MGVNLLFAWETVFSGFYNSRWQFLPVFVQKYRRSVDTHLKIVCHFLNSTLYHVHIPWKYITITVVSLCLPIVSPCWMTYLQESTSDWCRGVPQHEGVHGAPCVSANCHQPCWKRQRNPPQKVSPHNQKPVLRHTRFQLPFGRWIEAPFTFQKWTRIWA